MLFIVIAGVLSLIGCAATVLWAWHVVRTDNPYEAKEANPLPPASCPERGRPGSEPQDITAIFRAFDEQRRETTRSEPKEVVVVVSAEKE